MNAVKASAAIPEQKCPACGGAFTISASSRKRKVQCPHCREVVNLPSADGVNGKHAAASGHDAPAAAEWIARCEMLQARIEALEHRVEALQNEPRTSLPRIPEGLADISGGSRERRATGHAEEARVVYGSESPVPGDASEHALARVFQPPTPEIALVFPAGDRAGREVAETLSEVLARSGWKVRGVREDASLAPGGQGLTFVASSSLPLELGTSTLSALRQAGYAVTFQLDPARDSRETVLIVGAGVAMANGAGAAS